MLTARDESGEEWQKLSDACGPLRALIDADDDATTTDADKLNEERNWTREYLSKNHEVTDENIEALYSFAKHTYEKGMYPIASAYLYYYRYE